ncbi:thiamine phosphate synthase [Winogradskyella arenosi]|uniref:Thiamine-phosphate pyrophosphorylase n=1 Tax=Winogradskyella arenosi TaxID=533325 RepID=A0A368ZE31_9FLAO|nr:thiamine phosphate synthase [Winogradskyella arenosi]RCW90659.1 thiamine-phosphate pyrophosphorylase [Winogradskyella arenosi]
MRNVSKLHYISEGATAEIMLQNIQSACTSGAEWVQLSLATFPEAEHLELAQSARGITSHFQTRLIISDAYEVAKAVKADGVHIENADRCPTGLRTELYTWQIIGATAYTLQDCEALVQKEVDYIFLGPYKVEGSETLSKPSLGIKGYAAIMEVLQTPIPVIGFGGIKTTAVKDILETGVSGVAVSEEITQNFDTIKTFHHLLKASVIAEQRHTFE